MIGSIWRSMLVALRDRLRGYSDGDIAAVRDKAALLGGRSPSVRVWLTLPQTLALHSVTDLNLNVIAVRRGQALVQRIPSDARCGLDWNQDAMQAEIEPVTALRQAGGL